MEEFSDTQEAPAAHYWAAKSLFALGKPKESVRLLEELLASETDLDTRFYNSRLELSIRSLASEVYRNMGEFERAKAVLVND